MEQAWVPTRLTSEQREERRREAVRQWYAAWEAGGVRDLRRRPKTGRPPKLGAAQWRRVAALLRRGAGAYGHDTEQWTLVRVAHLIRREFGVRYPPHYLARPLRARGFRPQHPAVQAKARDDARVAAWVKHDWVLIKKRLAARGASLPSWTRRVTRFGAAGGRRGPRRAARPCCAASASGARCRASSPSRPPAGSPRDT